MKKISSAILIASTMLACKAYTPQADTITHNRQVKQAADAEAKAIADAAAEAERKRVLALQETTFKNVISSLDLLDTDKLQRSESFPSIMLQGQMDYALIGNEPKKEAKKDETGAKLKDENGEEVLMEEPSPEEIAAAKVKVVIANDAAPKKLSKGFCVLYNATDIAFDPLEVENSNITLSEKGKVAYSMSNDLRANECRNFFELKLGKRIVKDFFNMHVSYFQIN